MFRTSTTSFFLKCLKKPPLATVRFSSTDSHKVAVILSGCGVYDGSEIHEAVSVLSHLTRNGAIPVCFGPDVPQMHVINHLKGEEDKTNKRYVLQESARIARGTVHDIKELIKDQNCYDAVVFPGGFGAAKNLSDFAVKGSELTIHPEVLKVIKDFHCAKKPLAFMCISPILAAKAICNVQITLGKDSCNKWPHRGAIGEAKKLGAVLSEAGVNQYIFDRENLVLSTPAYMYDGEFHEIDDGIGIMINFLMTYIKTKYKN